MRIFLRLGHAQLMPAGVGDDLPQNIGQGERRKHSLQKRVQMFAVLGHARGGCEAKHTGALEAREAGIEQSGQDFPDAVARKLKHSRPSPSRMPL